MDAKRAYQIICFAFISETHFGLSNKVPHTIPSYSIKIFMHSTVVCSITSKGQTAMWL